MGSADLDVCYLLHLRVSLCSSSLVKSIVISPRCAPAMLSDFAHGVSHSPCSACAAFTDAYASKARSDPQEAQGDTHDKRQTDADAFVVLALNSSFVPLIDCLLLMFSVTRMFSEQKAMTLVPLMSLSSTSRLSFAQVSEWARDSHRPQTMGHVAFSSRCCRSLQNSGMFGLMLLTREC